jgi:hypothetical protein
MQNNILSIARTRLPGSHKSAAKGRTESLKASAIAVSGLKRSLEILKESTDVISSPVGPVVKGAVGGLLEVVSIAEVLYAMLRCEEVSDPPLFQTAVQNIEEIDQLINRVDTLERSIFRPLQGKKAIPKSTIELVTDFAK